MDNLVYQPHEARRHTQSIKETVQRACRSVFTEPGIAFRIKDGPWYLAGPAEQVTVKVFQKTGCCQRKPLLTLVIDRPRTAEGMLGYTQARADLLEWSQHAANTRLLGHLQRQCPFLPKIEATLAYDLKDHA
jgi:hypothetical protein